MSNDREVVIVSGARTAIGSYGGSLKDVAAVDIASFCVKEAINRAGINADTVEQTFIGNVLHSDTRDMYISRYAAVKAGVPVESPALTVNRLCGSGLQSIVSAAQAILLSDIDVAVAGGAESMSRVPYWNQNLRWGQRMGDSRMIDAMIEALNDPFGNGHMGITAENIAEKWKISREDQDALAVESHRRAANAIEAGIFKEQILPVEIPSRKERKVFDTDENPRSDTTPDKLAKMRAVFKEDGVVTAGNSSSLNDGAAAVVLMDRKVAESKGLKPMAKLVGYSVAGVDPEYMGVGPVPALNQLFKKTGLTVDDIDFFELNEAFAAQAIACIRDLDIPMEKVNPNGSGISLGHPLGATGAILVVKAIYELKRTNSRYAAVSMCIGGGQGIAAIFENII